MADETLTPAPATPAPSQVQIDAALKEYNEHSDRVAVLKKYPFLVAILNNPKPESK